MKSLEEILKETQEKAQKMAAEAKQQLRQAADVPIISGSDLSSSDIQDIKEKLSQADIDDILKSTVEKYLSKSKPIKAKVKESKTKKSSEFISKAKSKVYVRLDLDLVMKAYEATGLIPCKAVYWFYENREKNPLVQVSTMSEDRTAATPLTAYTLMQRELLLKSDNPPAFITKYRDLEKPSHQWTAGRVSQVSGLNISYVMGFESGFDGNAPGHPNCTELYHLGYEDGLKIRNQMIEKGLIEPDPDDMYADETDEDILFELYRVRGYVPKEK